MEVKKKHLSCTVTSISMKTEEFLIRCASSSPVLLVSERGGWPLPCAVNAGVIFAVEDKISAQCSDIGSRCKPEQQMMYAGSKNKLVQTAELTKVFEIRNTEDLTEEWLREKLGFFH
ncbi:hypothetical protein ASZ78_012294 [Callipepla squamata]|uniref:Glia maturation factor beta n=1 Tax=Callipepla squamata TaxID=9009 RepID=A0A226MEQ5_CALSU|nr:hypothetical protein ASZ78_012294 [Callipepla squamata]